MRANSVKHRQDDYNYHASYRQHEKTPKKLNFKQNMSEKGKIWYLINKINYSHSAGQI
jgi:hypothetical protein